MEVKPGYKQTEVGVIPEDWGVFTLGEAVNFLDGQRRPVKDVDRAKMQGDVPYYGASGIVDYVNDYLFDEDLILLGEDGENILSRNTRLAFRIKGKAWINNHAHVLRPKLGNSIGFLTEYLESMDYEKFNSGTAQPKLNKLTCIGMLIALPPTLAEQEAIAEALSDADTLIESLEQLLVKKRHIKQGAMQELLTGKKRLPGFSGDWVERPIGEISTSSSEKNSTGGALPVLTCSKHFGFVDSLGFFKNQVFSRNLSTYKIIRGGQIGYPANHIEEGSIGLQDLYEVALVSPIYIVFSVTEGIDPFFVHRLLKLDSYRTKFSTATNASVNRRGSLRWPEFSTIEVSLPRALEEQLAVSLVIRDMESDIALTEDRLKKTRQIKQGMMQELLTGRIRLV